ncbi:MAG: type I restriction enzyme HsdR N-terminal domain-containing protein [Bacteroidota bacterium]|nr:type I restriction enzyme HsdR N-terminal domain-containing protein [Bacteroidota bacterium]
MFNIKSEGGRKYILDVIRRKFVTLTPEEWVRQNFIRYLNEEKRYPLSLIAVEAGFSLYKLNKRTDILIFDRAGNPVAMVECKAPEVPITREVFEQIIRYNLKFKLNFLIVTNGLQHYCCRLNHESNTTGFLKEIPAFEILINS